MNRGGKTSPASGFTIVETIIVMAVTSALLISAMIAMSGRQARTEFQVATQSAVREFQSTISQIESGRYESTGNFICQSNPPNVVVFADGVAGDDKQGANAGCIYLGLAIVFGQDTSNYKKYIIGGSRLVKDATPTLAKNITEANPTTDERTATSHAITRGLVYAGARYIDNTGSYVSLTGADVPMAVRLMVDLQGDEGLSGDRAGSTKVSVHNTGTIDAANVATSINSATKDQRMKGIEVCFASAALDQSVIISVGNGWGNKVDSTVVGGKKCGWAI